MKEVELKLGEINTFAANPRVTEKKGPFKIIKDGREYTQIEYSLSNPLLKRSAIVIKALAITILTLLIALCFRSVRQSFAKGLQKNEITKVSADLNASIAYLFKNIASIDDKLVSNCLRNALEMDQKALVQTALSFRNAAKDEEKLAKLEALNALPDETFISEKLSCIAAKETILTKLKERITNQNLALIDELQNILNEAPTSSEYPVDPKIKDANLQGLQDLCQKRLTEGKLDFAVQCLIRILHLNPVSAFKAISDYMNIADQMSAKLKNELLKKNPHQGAIDIWNKSIAKFELLKTKFAEAALVYYKKENKPLPDEYYQIATDPLLVDLCDVKAILELGTKHFYAGRKLGARQAFTKAFELNPEEMSRYQKQQQLTIDHLSGHIKTLSDSDKAEKLSKSVVLLNSLTKETNEIVKELSQK